MPMFCDTTTNAVAVFTTWAQQTTASATLAVWQGWATAASTSAQMFPPQQSLDEIARLQEEQLFYRQRSQAAEKRADDLLLEILTPEQRAQYQREKWFIVDGKSGTRYRLRRAVSGSIDVLNADGGVRHRLCAHLRDAHPLPDHLIAQKFMLEHHEGEFLKVANRH